MSVVAIRFQFWFLAALLGWTLGGCRQAAPEEAEEDPLPKEPVPVRAVRAELTTLRPSVDLVGTLVALPECTTTVSPQVAGWVQKVLVVEGATVKAGDDLLMLDTRLADVEVVKATASVAEKQAVLAKLKRGYLPQELEMARHEVQKSKEAMDSLRAEVAALEPLRQNKELSDVQYQKFTSTLRAAEAGHAAAEAKLRLLEAGTPREEIAEADSRVAIAQAELAAARLNRELCRIVQPDGGHRNATPGPPGYVRGTFDTAVDDRRSVPHVHATPRAEPAHGCHPAGCPCRCPDHFAAGASARRRRRAD